MFKFKFMMAKLNENQAFISIQLSEENIKGAASNLRLGGPLEGLAVFVI
jgi:hypothetical protein